MELTENELLDQELNFDWNNSNNSYSYNIFPYNSQETHEDQQQSNKILDAVPNPLQRPRVMTDLLAQSNLLSTYLSQSNIAECINLQNKKRDEEHLCSNHTKPTNKYDLSTLFDCVLTPRTVDYNKLLTRIDNIVQHLSNLYNHQNDIMNVKEELNALRETISNQINMHEEASEKRIEEIFTRLLEVNREKYHNFIKEEISKQSTFILSQINESLRTLVDQIPQDNYIQINSLNQSFSNKPTKETSEHCCLFEQVFEQPQNLMNVDSIITSNSAHSQAMNDYHLTSINIREREMDYSVATNSVTDVIESEFVENSALHVAQLNKMSLKNIILQ